jgi:hypothetical protein
MEVESMLSSSEVWVWCQLVIGALGARVARWSRRALCARLEPGRRLC